MIDFNIKDYTRSLLPPGRYTFIIKNAHLKSSKKGNQMANIQLDVVSEFRRGQRVFKDFNIYHPNETTQTIAREELARLCATLGIEDLKELAELNNKIVDADVIQEPYNDDMTNKVKKFFEAANGSYKLPDFQAPDAKFNDEIPF